MKARTGMLPESSYEVSTRPRQPKRGTHRRSKFRRRPLNTLGIRIHGNWNKSYGHMTAGQWAFVIRVVLLVASLIVLAVAAFAYYHHIGAAQNHF
jgi:hypothetical protein